MLVIRLKKISIKKNLSYVLVVTAKKVAPTSNKFLEKIGHYKPLPDKWSNKNLVIDVDRLLFWLHRGATLNRSFLFLIKPLVVNGFKTSKKKII